MKINNIDLFFYKNFYNDLNKFNDKQLIYHYRHNGIRENRFCNLADFYKKYPNFNVTEYKKNSNLNFTNDVFYLSHYHFNSSNNEYNNEYNNESINNEFINNQSINNQYINKQKFYELYPDFNLEFYKLHSDLIFNKDIDYFNHYHTYGKIEDRIINIESFNKLHPNFNLEFYKLHDDLNFNSDIEYFNHYHNYGKNESRIINKESFYKKYPDFNLESYKNNNFNLLLNTDIEYVKYYYNLHVYYDWYSI